MQRICQLWKQISLFWDLLMLLHSVFLKYRILIVNLEKFMKVIIFFPLYPFFLGMSLYYFIWKLAQRLFLLSSWPHLPSSQNLVLAFPYSLLAPVESHFSSPLPILSSCLLHSGLLCYHQIVISAVVETGQGLNETDLGFKSLCGL